jgi:hypothetical protein
VIYLVLNLASTSKIHPQDFKYCLEAVLNVSGQMHGLRLSVPAHVSIFSFMTGVNSASFWTSFAILGGHKSYQHFCNTSTCFKILFMSLLGSLRSISVAQNKHLAGFSIFASIIGVNPPLRDIFRLFSDPKAGQQTYNTFTIFTSLFGRLTQRLSSNAWLKI